jgi:hypothetical protein
VAANIELRIARLSRIVNRLAVDGRLATLSPSVAPLLVGICGDARAKPRQRKKAVIGSS